MTKPKLVDGGSLGADIESLSDPRHHRNGG